MSSSFALHPHPTVRRYSNLLRAPRPSAMAGAMILCAAILIAAFSTVDPLWWHLHFSRLGMFADASGYTFNGGVVASGLVIAAGGVPLAVHLAGALASGRVVDARAARMLPPLLVTLGLCLALIGVVPLTMNEFLHDRAANGVLLSFLGLVVVSRRTLPELPAFLGRYAISAVIVLAVGIGFMVAGVINLAAFEVLAFGSVLSWVHLLERSVRRLAVEVSDITSEAEPAVVPIVAIEQGDAAYPSAAEVHVVRRGSRRRVPAAARPGIRITRVAHLENELRVPPEAATVVGRAQRANASVSRRVMRRATAPRVTGPRRSSASRPRARRAPSPASRD